MASKHKARYLLFETPMWGIRVHFIEAATMTAAVTEVRRRWPALDVSTGDTDHTDGVCVQSPEDEPIVMLPVGATAGCVAHECLHATLMVLKKVGASVSVHDDETAAYTLQRIVDAVAPWLTTRRRPALPTPPKPAPPAPPETTED
jgi:hypothetical protein